MASILKIQAGRVNNVEATTWVAPQGTLFYDEDSGILRVGDDVTPGGRLIYPDIGTSGIVGGNLIPAVNTSTGALSTGTIGTLSNPWSTIYLSSSTFYVGGNALVVNNGTLSVNGLAVGTGFTGSRGSLGFTGSIGYTGSTGFGYAGSVGYVGSAGIAGYVGSAGADGKSINITGVVYNSGSLPVGYTGSVGDSYIVSGSGHLWSWDGATWVDAGPYVGPTGYTGSIGYVGSAGSGFVGSQGDLGYVGSAGLGYTGSTGAGFVGSRGSNNLVFTNIGTTRKLTGYIDPNGSQYPVRTTELLAGAFVINLASFTPITTSAVLPAISINWDISCAGFSVSVVNPLDFPTEYLSSVNSLVVRSGAITTNLTSYTKTGPSATPAGGIPWTQTFSTNGIGTIRPISTTIAGGTAGATVVFNSKSDTTPEVAFPDITTTWSVTWNTPTLAISMVDPTGSTFLQTYTQAPYTINITGMTNPSNYTTSVTAVGGTVSNLTGQGNFIFDTPVHKDNTNLTRSVNVVATFSRPSAVTGSAYTAQLTASDLILAPTFTYPSFWIFTASTSAPPTRTIVVSGSAFTTGVTVLANQVKTFAGLVSNTLAIPRVFWFGVRSSIVQPTVFQTGASASLLSGVTAVTRTVQLSPDTVPSGYVLENYNLYGIVLQPGNTYVSIS